MTEHSKFHVADLDISKVVKIPELHRRGLMLALAAPSGAGKTTMARELLKADPWIDLSISCTTRKPRGQEKDGVDYYFVDQEEFEKMIAEDKFLEYAKVFGNFYGTPKEPVEASLSKGRDVLFDIDWQGVRQLREKAPADLMSVFISPPSADELLSRLQKRAQDTAETISKRMAEASQEMSHFDEFDYVIINRLLEDSMYKLRTILGAERMKRERLAGLTQFVADLRHSLSNQ